MDPIPPARAVQADLQSLTLNCEFCGYDLHGLAPNAPCPECGIPVGGSVKPDALRFGDPAWLEKLRRGMSLKIWNIGLMILGSLAAVLLLRVLTLPPTAIKPVQVVGAALGLWAIFLITTQEPRIALEEDPVTLRTVVRAAAVVAFSGAVLASVLPVNKVALIIAYSLSTAGWVQYFGEFVYLKRFAFRVPDLKLARSTRTVMWGTLICSAVLLVGGLIVALRMGLTTMMTTPGATPSGSAAGAAVTPPPLPMSVIAPLAAPMCVTGLAAFVFQLWYIRLLYAYRRLFATAKEQALQTAATAQPSPG